MNERPKMARALRHRTPLGSAIAPRSRRALMIGVVLAASTFSLACKKDRAAPDAGGATDASQAVSAAAAGTDAAPALGTGAASPAGAGSAASAGTGAAPSPDAGLAMALRSLPSPEAIAATMPVPRSGYRAAPVGSDAGTIRGRVLWSGPRPARTADRISKDVRLCGAERPSQRLLVGAEGGVRNTLVWLSDIRAGRKLDTEARATIDRIACDFEPRLQVAPLGGTVDLRSQDPVLHNVHAYLGAATLFNVGLTVRGQRHHKLLKKPGLVELHNDAGQPWMRAYLMVAEHPYYAVTDARGEFTLTDVPPGQYTLRTWHESWRVLASGADGRPEYDVHHTSVRTVEVPRKGVVDVPLILGP